MISAMPAVALRRERRRSQARAFSRDGSISFGDRRLSAADFGRKFSQDSLRRSSIVSARVQIERNEYELKRRKSYLLQTGAICITTGVIVLLLGLSLDTAPLYTVSLMMIVLGFLICLFRVFIGLDHSSPHLTDYNACRIRRSLDEKKVSIANSATSYDAESDFKEVRSGSKQTNDPQEFETLRVTALPAMRRDSRLSETGGRRIYDRPGGLPHHSFSQSECGQDWVQQENQPRRMSSGDSGVDMVQAERGTGKRSGSKQSDIRTLSSPNIVTLSRNLSLAPATTTDAESPIAILFPPTEAV